MSQSLSSWFFNRRDFDADPPPSIDNAEEVVGHVHGVTEEIMVNEYLRADQEEDGQKEDQRKVSKYRRGLRKIKCLSRVTRLGRLGGDRCRKCLSWAAVVMMMLVNIITLKRYNMIY